MAFLTAQLQQFSLFSSGVSLGDTTMTLSSFQSIDGVDLAMTDFGSIGYMTIEPGSRDREEQISFTGITQNANGSATLTGIKTVLFLSPYTESSGFSKSHPGGVIAVVTNTSGFYNKFGIKANDEIVTGFWAVPDPVSPTDIANRQWVLSVVNGGAVSQNSVIVAGTAGETVVAGQVLYLKVADGFWWKADASVPATVNEVQFGIAQGSGTATNSITGGVLIRGVDTHQSGLTTGAFYYVRNGGGLPSASAGTISKIIGQGAQTATTLYFDPNFQFNAYASTVLVGVVEEATQAEVDAKTAVGGTGARLYMNPSWIAKKPTVRVYTANDTWTKPSGLNYVVVEVVGGGGGGGGSGDTATDLSGSGGGGGGYSKKIIAVATLGATETVTVGASGNAGTTTSDGTGGGTSSFGAHASATGGAKGIVGSVTGIGGGVGGTASGGDINITGQAGGSTFHAASENFGAGSGGSSMLGLGGLGIIGDANQPGTAGSGYGAGGSGGSKRSVAQIGGSPTVGVVIVTEC